MLESEQHQNASSIYLALTPVNKQCIQPEKLSAPYNGWKVRASEKVVVCPEDLGIIPTGFKLASNKPCILHFVLESWLIRLGATLATTSVPLHNNTKESVPIEIVISNVFGDFIAIKEGAAVASFFVTEIASNTTIINVKSNAN